MQRKKIYSFFHFMASCLRGSNANKNAFFVERTFVFSMPPW
jgi:hypothetical protein